MRSNDKFHNDMNHIYDTLINGNKCTKVILEQSMSR